MELIVLRIQFPDGAEENPIIYLKEKEGERILPIMIGLNEAQSINMALNNFKTPRPLTHDLIVNLFEALGLKLERVVINDLRENTYFARLILFDEERKTVYSIDARPSDSIAIALRSNAPIFVSEYVLKKALSLEGS
uniref:Bifunctional nuclease family protein n=1 Tax=candidate division WOR-3 bacterium TaxID=2052148 RepID=A0A7C2PK63_UNCW3